MLQALGLYLAATGGAGAGAQVARGAVRGVARLVRGDIHGALAETAGGLIAPVVSTAHQLWDLGAAVYKAATSLTAEVRGRAASPVVPSPTRVIPRRGRSAPVAVNASA